MLGEGAYARVQTCINLITNKEYAVKVSTPTFVFMLGLFWTMCSAQGVCGFLFVLGFFCVPFFPLTVQRLILLAVPSHYCFHFVAAYGSAGRNIHTPCISLNRLQGSLVVRTLCTGGCAKTKTHKEEGGVLKSYVRVFTLLCTLYICTFSTFPLRLGVDLTLFYFLELPFLFNMKCTFILF